MKLAPKRTAFTHQLRSRPGSRIRSEAKWRRIVEAALRHLAEYGYHAARVEDIAEELEIAKGSIFQHFGSKGRLFPETYKKAVRSFHAYLHAPLQVLEKGFFETLRHRLVRTEHLVREDWIPYRVALQGNYGIDLSLIREINRFLVAEDPYGPVDFVRRGIVGGVLQPFQRGAVPESEWGYFGGR